MTSIVQMIPVMNRRAFVLSSCASLLVLHRAEAQPVDFSAKAILDPGCAEAHPTVAADWLARVTGPLIWGHAPPGIWVGTRRECAPIFSSLERLSSYEPFHGRIACNERGRRSDRGCSGRAGPQ